LARATGRKFEDPNADYESLLADYRKGGVNYGLMGYMIKAARRFDPDIVPELSEKYKKYIAALNNKQRLDKDIIGFLADNISSGKSTEVTFFKRYEKKIDKVMQRKGYAGGIIDKAIYYEIVVPFFNEQNKNPNLPMTGMYLNGIKPDYSEADWEKLEKMICGKFNKSIAGRNILASRFEWYQRHWNIEAASRVKLIELEKYPPDLKYASVAINGIAWNAFLYVTDKETLQGYIKWMEKLLQVRYYASFIDTYANLLYKIGKNEEAIKWEEKAVEVGKDAPDNYKIIVAQMKSGEPTYGVKILGLK